MNRSYILGLLTLTHLLGYLDRFIFSLLVEPIKADVGLSDFQIGILLGPSIIVPLTLVGLFGGWLTDRVNRPRLLAAGIATWCLFTAATCLADSFGELFVARIGVGIGEAVLGPVSYSLIADLFDRRERAPAISVFMIGTFGGAGLAYLLGGPLLKGIAALHPVTLPGIGPLADWQAAFLFVGAPGLLVALLMLTTVRTPPRTELGSGQGAGVGAALRHVAGRWTAYATLVAGAVGIMAVGSGIQWSASIFQRSYGWTLADVSLVIGLLFLIGGPLGTIVGAWAVGRWQKAGRVDAPARALLTGVTILVLSFIGVAAAPSPGFAVAALFLVMIGQAMGTAAGPTAMLHITPGEVRGQVASYYSLGNSLISQTVGTPLVGALADHFGAPAGLSKALLVNSIMTGGAVILLVALGQRRYRRAAEAMAE